MIKVFTGSAPILRKRCNEVEFGTVQTKRAIGKLQLAMKEQPHALAISANQIGLPIRMFAYNFIRDRASHGSYPMKGVAINPVFTPVEEDGKIVAVEGCLSLPKKFIDVERYLTIDAEWVTGKGDTLKSRLTATAAQCFQHEVDHLDGILMTDRVADYAAYDAL